MKIRKDDNGFLDIDKYALDEEWEEQPKLYKQYSDMLAIANMEVDEAKNALEVTKAELDQAIRLRPEKYRLNKVTDAGVKSCILAQDEYQMQYRTYLEAKHAADVLDGAVKALDHRKKALENLVFLHGQQYFSTPRARSEDLEEMETKKKRKVRKPLSREDLTDD